MSTGYSDAAPAGVVAPIQTDRVAEGEKPLNMAGMFFMVQSQRASIVVAVWLTSLPDKKVPTVFRDQAVSTNQTVCLAQALGSEAAINETIKAHKGPVKDGRCSEEGRVLANRFPAGPQAESRVEVQLDGLEAKVTEHAAILDNLYARFEDHKRVTTERLQALEELLKKALAIQMENNSS